MVSDCGTCCLVLMWCLRCYFLVVYYISNVYFKSYGSYFYTLDLEWKSWQCSVELVQILFDCVFVPWPCVGPSQACAVRLRAEGGNVVAVVVAPGVDRLALEGVHRATCQVPGR